MDKIFTPESNSKWYKVFIKESNFSENRAIYLRSFAYKKFMFFMIIVIFMILVDFTFLLSMKLGLLSRSQINYAWILPIAAIWLFIRNAFSYIRTLKSKPDSPQFLKEYRRCEPTYIGENETKVFFLSEKEGNGEIPDSHLEIPDTSCSEKITPELILSSAFYRTMRRRTRKISFSLLPYSYRILFYRAINQIIQDQLEKDNVAFFEDTIPFESYK